LFVYEDSESGIYKCKFYKHGKWVVVEVDDTLPCCKPTEYVFGGEKGRGGKKRKGKEEKRKRGGREEFVQILHMENGSLWRWMIHFLAVN
jgi:hypothetical protein